MGMFGRILYEPPGAASFGGYIPSANLYDEIEQALRTGAAAAWRRRSSRPRPAR